MRKTPKRIQKKPQPSEAQTQKAILEWLRLEGIFAWRSNTGTARYSGKGGKDRYVRYGMPGVSDILGISPEQWANNPLEPKNFLRGRFLAIEVKSVLGKLSLAQKAFLDAVESNGGIAIVARSLDDVIRRLR